MGADTDPRLTEKDAEIIRRKAKRLVGHYGYRSSDVQDIEQDLAMHVFQQTCRHHPERGSRYGFVVTVVKNKLLNLIQLKRAMKRNNACEVRAEEVGEAGQLDERGSPEQIDIQIDVRDLLQRMPEDLQQIARLRMAGHRESELEELLNLTRAQVRSRLHRIEKLFRDAHLDSENQ